jgi:hypothetical protein
VNVDRPHQPTKVGKTPRMSCLASSRACLIPCRRRPVGPASPEGAPNDSIRCGGTRPRELETGSRLSSSARRLPPSAAASWDFFRDAFARATVAWQQRLSACCTCSVASFLRPINEWQRGRYHGALEDLSSSSASQEDKFYSIGADRRRSTGLCRGRERGGAFIQGEPEHPTDENRSTPPKSPLFSAERPPGPCSFERASLRQRAVQDDEDASKTIRGGLSLRARRGGEAVIRSLVRRQQADPRRQGLAQRRRRSVCTGSHHGHPRMPLPCSVDISNDSTLPTPPRLCRMLARFVDSYYKDWRDSTTFTAAAKSSPPVPCHRIAGGGKGGGGGGMMMMTTTTKEWDTPSSSHRVCKSLYQT